jgi:hypothetical protein
MSWCQQSESTKNAELTRRTSLGLAKPAAAFASSNLSDLSGHIDHTIFYHRRDDHSNRDMKEMIVTSLQQLCGLVLGHDHLLVQNCAEVAT